MDLLTIANEPVVQFGAIVAALALAARLGFDVPGAFRKLLRIKDTESVLYDVRESQAQLKGHFNDETTLRLSNIETGMRDLSSEIKGLSSKMEEQARAQDKTNYLLETIISNGIKCHPQ